MASHPIVRYTVSRFALVIVAAVLLYLLGFRSWALAFGALILSLPFSWFLLRRQRDAVANYLGERSKQRNADRAQLRATLRGEEQGPREGQAPEIENSQRPPESTT